MECYGILWIMGAKRDLHILIPSEEYISLEQLAEKEMRSLTQMIIIALRFYLRARRKI